MEKLNVDTVIVGAGPAGSIAALNLAPTRSVLLIDKTLKPTQRIGESLIPAARRLLYDMGLLSEFENRNYLEYYGNQVCWGTNEIIENDFLRNIDNHGWYIDRSDFEMWLREVASRRGARIFAPSRVISIIKHDNYFLLKILFGTQEIFVNTKTLIDAGGRTAPIARQLGAKRIRKDHLVCSWLSIKTNHQLNRLSYIEATPHGWWYISPIPNKRYIISFYTDADLIESSQIRNAEYLLKNSMQLRKIKKIITDNQFYQIDQSGYTAAHSGTIEPYVGENWLATGDAALCFDPISSQGLFNAMYTGLAAAETINHFLSGYKNSFKEYKDIILSIKRSYNINYNFYYKTQTKWKDFNFWKRRSMDTCILKDTT